MSTVELSPLIYFQADVVPHLPHAYPRIAALQVGNFKFTGDNLSLLTKNLASDGNVRSASSSKPIEEQFVHYFSIASAQLLAGKAGAPAVKSGAECFLILDNVREFLGY